MGLCANCLSPFFIKTGKMFLIILSPFLVLCEIQGKNLDEWLVSLGVVEIGIQNLYLFLLNVYDMYKVLNFPPLWFSFSFTQAMSKLSCLCCLLYIGDILWKGHSSNYISERTVLHIRCKDLDGPWSNEVPTYSTAGSSKM